VFVVIAKCELRIVFNWVHGHVKCKDVVVNEILLDHAIKKWYKVGFCHRGIGQANDSVEAASENVLGCNVSELKRIYFDMVFGIGRVSENALVLHKVSF
jgi:hypothetical protein